MEPVRSPRNRRVADAVRLRRARDRKRDGLTILEGPHLVREAVARGADIRHVFGLETDTPILGVTWIPVSELVMQRLADTESPQGPVAVLAIPAGGPPSRDHLTLEVGDPGNAGTLIRTAAAFCQDVVVRPGAVDPWSPKVLRSAAGAHFRTLVTDVSIEAGVIVTVPSGGIDPVDFGRVLDPARIWSVVVGSEPHGIPEEEVKRADVQVTVPMPGGTESLNAAMAGGIVAYELARWRKSAGGSSGGH